MLRAVRPVPRGDGVAGHDQRDDVGQPRAVANGSLPELQERLVGLWGGPPARHLEEHRQNCLTVERGGARLRCWGCACSPSGRSSSPPTRPRSGSTRSAARRLRGRRAAPPADRGVDRLRLRHRPAGRVRHARLRRLPPGDAAAGGHGRARAPARAAGLRLRAADRARLRARRAAGRRAVPGRGRGARVRARRPAGAADRARAVGERRGAARRALAAGARARDHRLPRPDGRARCSRARCWPRCGCASGPTS